MNYHRPDSIIAANIEKIKKAIADDDYQVIKAAREGVDVDKLYPGHRALYEKRINALHELEKRAEAIATENKKEGENKDE